MKKFIEIINSNKKRIFLNINHIEEVLELDENECCIYMAFNSPDADIMEQDCHIVNRPYDEIVALIKESS